MFKRIIDYVLRRTETTASILSEFERTRVRLIQLESRRLNAADSKNEQAASLMTEANVARREAFAASKAAAKLEELIR